MQYDKHDMSPKKEELENWNAEGRTCPLLLPLRRRRGGSL
jgi:hypothetical protein